MLIQVEADAGAVSLRAAALVAELVTRNPRAVLGLAAGATPLGLYEELARRHLDFSGITVFGLDEYMDLPADHPASCTWAVRRNLIERVNLDPSRIHLLDGIPDGDVTAACAAFDRRIAAAGGLDLQILGLGVNGHIGFNEPGCSLSALTHPTALSASTRTVNRPGFPSPDEVPKAAVTMGIGTILAARRVLLLATGAAKAETVAKAVEGPITARVPASSLQMHADAVMLLDTAAAAALRFGDDYAAEAATRSERGGQDWLRQAVVSKE
ncbi:MAG: glucosamine-6-phosphate deaminase [Phaeospirillum sp.]|nr:glucosamine-6-phosphate deaminase [Phaeospirillum sp.]